MKIERNRSIPATSPATTATPMDSIANWTRKEVLKIALPSFLAILLFVITIFVVALPTFREHLLEQKKQTLIASTAVIGEILTYYERMASTGVMPLPKAQAEAIEQIRQLHYGPEGKDYFWINDLEPRMIMHPYRPDLEGADLSSFSDPAGKQLFREMVAVVRQTGAGFVEYHWQWQDNPTLVGPKLSHVQLFRPWGWIIGSGIYLQDVQADISRIVRELTYISLAIFTLILALSAYIVRHSVSQTHQRLVAENELAEYRDQLEILVEQRTRELKEAMARVKVLSGFLPICAACKKIRDDKGYWNQIESYIRDHSEAEFSHSICPDCTKKLYPGLNISNRNPRVE